jgi:hypothetical protein
MQTHLSSELKGPVTQARSWWPRAAEERVDEDEAPPSLFDPEVRADLVQRIRSEIASGTYDTPEKWEKALDRLVERLHE